MNVGFGRADITPALGTPCALGIDNDCEAILDPIFARVLHLRSGDAAAAIVSCDVIGFYAPETRTLQADVAAVLDLPPERVIVHGTHSHQSPGVRMCVADVLDEVGVDSFSRSFFERLRAQVRAAAQQARATAAAGVRVGAARVERVASNRRCHDERGQVQMRASRPPAAARAYPEGDIDPYLRALVFDTDAGPVALLAYACHATCTGGDEAPYVTGDFPGEALRRLEAALPGLRALYVTSPCGDVNPAKWVGDGNDLDARKRDRDAMGERVAGAAQQALAATVPVEGDGLSFAARAIELPLRPEMNAAALAGELANAARRYAERHAAGERGWGGWGLLNAAHKVAVQRQARDGRLPTRVTALGVAGAVICALPAESLLAAGRRVLGAAGAADGAGAFAVPMAYVDYTPGYLPPAEAWPHGGYEVRVAHCAPEAFALEVAAAEEATRAALAGEGA